MPTYTIDVPEPDEAERGIRVACPTHDEHTEFERGYRTITFHCPECGYEIEITVHDVLDWRELRELC